ncbi:MAG: hypothetical protein IJ766_10040 [Clostridia bacterium]|nr:hypothetical protein [Clostridia bacterium]
MAEKKKYLGIASDMIFSIAAVVVLNAVIQLFIYPSFNKRLGAALYGEAITVMSMVAVVGVGFGIALNYSRMVMRTKKRAVKGDYNIFLLLAWLLCIPAAVLTEYLFAAQKSALNTVCIAILMISTVARYYSDVEFKLNINYKGYFVYYVFIAVGYCLGMPIFFKTGNWLVPLIIGEIAAVAFTAVRGKLYRKPFFARSEHFTDNAKSVGILSLSYLADTLMQNADRLLLSGMTHDGAMVTTFYNAALIGKVIALLTTSLNSVLIGYLSKFEGKFTKKFFTIIALALLILGIVAVAACTVVSHIFIRLMYGEEIYEMCKPYFLIANAGQVLYFISGTIMVVVLRFAKEKYQMHINILYAVLYLAVVPALTSVYQIWGLAWGILAVNLIKYIVVYIIGIAQLSKRNKAEPASASGEKDFDVFIKDNSK